MKQIVATAWSKSFYGLADQMRELIIDGWEIVSFQVHSNTLGYEAIVVLKREDAADEG